LSESGEAGGDEPLTPEEALVTAAESSALMAELPDAEEEPQLPAPPAGRGVARNTAIFSILTGVSRIIGLLREIVAASFFGTGGPASAFTLAFQVPNLFANLFANAALSAAFVPVFT
jgi:putative peptidoglycan lipid II flippase